jgi:hypothetical protein
LLEGSQALPARPSDKGRMRVKTLGWYEAEALDRLMCGEMIIWPIGCSKLRWKGQTIQQRDEMGVRCKAGCC